MWHADCANMRYSCTHIHTWIIQCYCDVFILLGMTWHFLYAIDLTSVQHYGVVSIQHCVMSWLPQYEPLLIQALKWILYNSLSRSLSTCTFRYTCQMTILQLLFSTTKALCHVQIFIWCMSIAWFVYMCTDTVRVKHITMENRDFEDSIEVRQKWYRY